MAPSAALKQQQPLQSQHHHQAYKHLKYPYYHHGQHHYHAQMYSNYWQDGNVGSANPSGIDKKPDASMKIASPHVDNKNIDIQTIMRDLMVAKAAAVANNTSSLSPSKNAEEKSTPTDTTSEHRRKIKKRPAPSSSPSVQSNDSGSLPTSLAPTRSLNVVSDTGSDTSSSSSLCSSSTNNFESFSAPSCNGISNTATIEKTAVKNENTDAAASVARGGSRLKRLKLRMKDDFN